MEVAEYIETKCRSCSKSDPANNCPNWTCVDCLVHHHPRNGCISINTCRESKARNYNTCIHFTAKEWD